MDGRPNRRNKAAFSNFSGVVHGRPPRKYVENKLEIAKVTFSFVFFSSYLIFDFISGWMGRWREFF